MAEPKRPPTNKYGREGAPTPFEIADEAACRPEPKRDEAPEFMSRMDLVREVERLRDHKRALREALRMMLGLWEHGCEPDDEHPPIAVRTARATLAASEVAE